MIEVEDLDVVLGGRAVLHRVALAVPPGSVTGLLGPNGAGKSTLLRTVAGLVRPERGRVRIGREDYPAAWRNTPRVGAFLSAEWLPGRLTAADLLRYHADLLGVPEPTAMLERVGLAGMGRRRIRTFSLGMRQRLGLAVAMLGDPGVLLLDEPMNGLDPDGIRWFRTVLAEFAGSGGSALVSSHLMAELEHLADRVVLLNGGRVLRAGPVESFRSVDRPDVVLVTDRLDRLVPFLRAAGVAAREEDGRVVAAHDDPAEVARLVVGGGFALSHLSSSRRTLEDGYFAELALDEGAAR